MLFAGLGSSTDGHVMVAATGAGSARCQATGWDSLGPDQRVGVSCRTAAGQQADAEFTVQFVW